MNIVMSRTSVVKQLTEDGMLPAPRLSPSRSHSPISEMGKARSPARGRQVPCLLPLFYIVTSHHYNTLEGVHGDGRGVCRDIGHGFGPG